MAITAAEREAAHRSAREQQERLRRLTSLHRHDWPASRPAEAPQRPAPDPPQRPAEPERPGAARFAAPRLADIRRWRFGERRVAHRLAAEQATETHRRALDRHRDELAVHARRHDAHGRALARLEQERAAEQRLLQRVHGRLVAGDRPAGERAIVAGLAELSAASRLAGWHGDAVVVTITTPAAAVVPEREPDTTAGGKPTTRKLSQTERNESHAAVVAALTIAAARRALAAAPGVPVAIAAALDADGDVLAHCRVGRDAPKPASDAIVALYELDGDLQQAGRTGTLAPIDVSDHDELRALASGRARTNGR